MLTPEEYEHLRLVAFTKKVSMSALCREASLEVAGFKRKGAKAKDEVPGAPGCACGPAMKRLGHVPGCSERR
jgi:hypothetical protein